MESCLVFNWLLLLLMATLCGIQANIVQTFYDKMDPGQNVRGNIAAELTTRSRIQCSDRLVTLNHYCLYLVDWSVYIHVFMNILCYP